MGERWVMLRLGEDETLRCDSCSTYLHDQTVYLYMDANDLLDEIMRGTCWKKDKDSGEE